MKRVPVALTGHEYERPRRDGRSAARAFAAVALAGLAQFGAGCAAEAPSREAAAAARPADARLLRKEDLVYRGAFRLPRSDAASYSPGRLGWGLAFNPANRSLFMTGGVRGQQTTIEVAIIEPRITDSIDALPRATALQVARDPVEGRIGSILVPGSDPSYALIGGHLVDGERLIVSAYNYYDATNSQSTSHFVRPARLDTPGRVRGPIRVGEPPNARWVAGYMAWVPPEWRAAFGGPALTGLAGVSITSAASAGPSVWVFDPATLGDAPRAPSAQLVGYPFEQPLGPGQDTRNPHWNVASTIRGLVFPEGSRSVLLFGRHGLGTPCYGEPGPCGDPTTEYKGYHAYPYAYQVWAYDAVDLADVRAGRKRPARLQPYAVWTFELPYTSAKTDRQIRGATYDPASRRVYVSQHCGEPDCSPIIHVFELAGRAP